MVVMLSTLIHKNIPLCGNAIDQYCGSNDIYWKYTVYLIIVMISTEDLILVGLKLNFIDQN